MTTLHVHLTDHKGRLHAYQVQFADLACAWLYEFTRQDTEERHTVLVSRAALRPSCTCRDFTCRRRRLAEPCKHIAWAADHARRRYEELVNE